ncbi:hypothetical protein AB1L88_05215 [Tautonia sp. JC769]|uniref:hypothetical protein n=1 Tax=Tautonia sp. JC769 TaxID=3232135 RepID=UPI00345A921C
MKILDGEEFGSTVLVIMPSDQACSQDDAVSRFGKSLTDALVHQVFWAKRLHWIETGIASGDAVTPEPENRVCSA